MANTDGKATALDDIAKKTAGVSTFARTEAGDGMFGADIELDSLTDSDDHDEDDDDDSGADKEAVKLN